MLKKVIIFFITILSLGVGIVFSYDDISTHPQLSNAATRVFNNSTNPNKINVEQMKWIEYGASMEDTDPRYLNHFYNPKTGQGLKDGIWSGVSTKKWAQSQSSMTGDYSYQAILDNYRQGNKKRAWQGVGHILHLIQDMSVPAHVRNDGHGEGDLYEGWAQHFGNIQISGVAQINIYSLNQAFDSLANFTSDNFFSKDTINIGNISEYKIIENKDGGNKIKYLSKNINGKEVRMVMVDDSSFIPIYSIEKNQLLNQDYWSILSPKAIGYSAGVIELFANEFKKIDDKNAAELANMSLLQKLSYGLKKVTEPAVTFNDAAYTWGDIYMVMRPTVVGEFNAILAAANLTGKTIGAGNELVVDTSKTVSDKLAVVAGEVKGVFVAATEEKKPAEVIDNKIVTPKVANIDEVRVARVIDGDTIELVTGEKVRYIGVDSPELNGVGSSDDDCLAWAAKVRNEQLIQVGQVRLVSDGGAEKDAYGRLLRYVYAGNAFVNGQLASEGLAKAFFCQAGWNNCPMTSDATRKKIILDVANAAMANKRGLYSGICDKEIKVIKEPVLILVEENITQPKVQELAKGVQVFFSNGEPNRPTITEEVAIILDDGVNGDDEVVATTTEDIATSAPEIATTSEEIATTTEDVGTTTLEEINLDNVTLTLFDLNTSNEHLSGSTTVGVRIDGIASQVEYYIAENDDDPTDETVWLTERPNTFSVVDGEVYYEVHMWIRQNGSILPGQVTSSIYFDNEKPEIHFDQVPPIMADQTQADFNINCSDNSQAFLNDLHSEEKATTWNYKLDEGEWLIGASDENIHFDNLDIGEHILSVEAIDHTLNVATSSFIWTIDPSLSVVDNQANHIVISEIRIGTEYSVYEEFIELYNPTEYTIDLSNYRLTRKTASGTQYNLVSAFRNLPVKRIFAHNYFTVSPADWITSNGQRLVYGSGVYTVASQSIAADNTITLYSDAGITVVDKVGYGSASDFEGQPFIHNLVGFSMERKHRKNSTSETMSTGNDRFLGNAYDTGNNVNDFVIRRTPEPQVFSEEPEIIYGGPPVAW